MSKRFRAAGILAALALWCWAPADAAEPAGTPASLVQAQLESAHKQDVDGYLAGLTTASRRALNEAVARQATLRAAEREFRAALDQKFGAAPAMLEDPPEDLPAALSRLVAAEVVGTTRKPDGSAEVRVRTSIKGKDGKVIVREEVLVARQENGAWKLVLGFTDGAAATQANAALRRVTEQVRKGELKDRHAAMIALDNGLSGKDKVSP